MKGRRIGWQAALEPRLKLVNIAEDLLDVQVEVFVLRQADGGLEQRELRVALHQTGKVLQGGRHIQI